jgi:hypothetical protein
MIDLKFALWYVIEKIRLNVIMFYYDLKLSFNNKHSIIDGIDEYFRIRNMNMEQLKEYLKRRDS